MLLINQGNNLSKKSHWFDKNNILLYVPHNTSKISQLSLVNFLENVFELLRTGTWEPPGGTWVFFGGYVPPGTPNFHPVLRKNSHKTATPFKKWANFLYPVLEFALKLKPRSRNGPIFYTPFQKVCTLKQPCFFQKDISLFVRLILQQERIKETEKASSIHTLFHR